MPPESNNSPPIIRAKLPPSSDDLRGYVCVWRKLRDHPRYRDSEFVHVWLHLILNATHKEMEAIFCGKKIVLQPGQLVTGRHSIARDTGVHDSKVNRILQQLKSEQQIEQQGGNLNSLITIRNWRVYQFSEQQIGQPANSNRTATEQPANTNNNEKNVIIKKPEDERYIIPGNERPDGLPLPLSEIIEYGASWGIPEQKCREWFEHLKLFRTNNWKAGLRRKHRRDWEREIEEGFSKSPGRGW